MSDQPKPDGTQQSKLDEKLYWMFDHPFFIDDKQLDAFYDAVIQPKMTADEEYELVFSDESAKAMSKKLGVELDLASIGGSLGNILSPLDVTAGAGKSWSSSNKKSAKQTATFRPINSPQRQLIQLTLQYLANYPERTFFVEDMLNDKEWANSKTIAELPRELVFIDLPAADEARKEDLPETKLIPMALEFENGRIETLYDKFKAELRDGSWEEYIDRFDPHEAVRVIEEATGGKGNIAWINYRIPRNDKRTFRVHFESNGRYNNGTFAYNLVKLGHEHGLRLIGTVHQDPDVRILAGYRK